MVICFRASTVSLQLSHLQPFFLSSLSGAVKSRRASSTESVASVMSSDKSMNRSKEKELAAHCLFVQVHCETVRPPKTRFGEAVRSALGAGAEPSSEPRFRRLSACSFSSSSSTSRSKLRINSWASSCIPKVNSAPSRVSQRATSDGAVGARERRARFCCRTAFLPCWPGSCTLQRASSGGAPAPAPARTMPSRPLRSSRSRACRTTRSPWRKSCGDEGPAPPAAGSCGLGSMQLLETDSRSQRKQVPEEQDPLPPQRDAWCSWQAATTGGAAW
mmetsp:Transcript_85360/g.265343  ORF Transcript_85360/g.265343 Transcript_85360/m.265343 type:complete len:274 (-) Transcript_85360:19-840(-)